MNDFGLTIRFALRSLVRHRWITATVVLTLGLAIGIVTAIFSLVQGILLRPLPYPDPDRLVWLHGRNPSSDELPLSPPDFLDYRERNRTFSHLAIYQGAEINISGGQSPEYVHGASVSAKFFGMLGVQPQVGRLFEPNEESGGPAQVALLSDKLWRRSFGGSPDVVGHSVRLDGKDFLVAGVLKPGFNYPDNALIWIPFDLSQDSMKNRRFHFVHAVGRIRPGLSQRQAQSDLEVIAKDLAKTYPDTNEGWSVRLEPLKDRILGKVGNSLLALLGATFLVFLIACANIANLLFGKSMAREKEIAVITALGAARGKLVRQLLLEGLILGLLGAGLGMLVAKFGLVALGGLATNLPRLEEVGINLEVGLFAVSVGLVASLLFSLAPALIASRPNLQAVLKESGRSSSSVRARWLGHALVVGEIALATVLIIGMVLLLRSFGHLLAVDPGFEPNRVLNAQIVLTSPRYAPPVGPVPFFQELLGRLRSVPGVKAAGAVTYLPLSGEGGDIPFTVEGRATVEGEQQNLGGFYRAATPGYFEAMGIPLLRGRTFTEQDREGAEKVVVIDKNLADAVWPGKDPLGQRISLPFSEPFIAKVVGIVGNVRQTALGDDPWQTLYLCSYQDAWQLMQVVVKSSGPSAESLSGQLIREVRAIDPDQPVVLRTIDDVVGKSLARPRFNMLLLTTFALFALLLTLLGLYAIVSASVARRTREIGIRSVLGAQPGDALRMVLKEGLVLGAIGVAVGLGVALAATRGISSLLFGVSRLDPLTFAGTAALLLAVTLVACLGPGRRATRVDPVTALRYDQ